MTMLGLDPDDDPGSVESLLKGPRHALVVGIDSYHDYPGFFGPLTGAVADARAVARVLEGDYPGARTDRSECFDVTILTDGRATKKLLKAAFLELQQKLERERAPDGSSTSRVVIYFAGHGVATTTPEEVDGMTPGYFLPQDANPNPRPQDTDPADKDPRKYLSMARVRDMIAVVLEALQVELAKRVSGEGEDTPVVAASDRVEDNAFGALFDFLSAWARLPAEKHPASAEASTVLREVFAGGLAFLAVRPHDEWQEAEIRLRVIADKGHEKTIAQLGGQPFLDHLAVAHKGYGEALGITTVKAAVETPAIRVARDAAVVVVREYVLRVAALVRKSDPQSEALSQRLLAPIVNWRDVPAKAGAAADPAAPADPSLSPPT